MNEHKTAIARIKLSAPARYLLRAGRILGERLDYGCGRGTDAAILCADKYDPHYAPARPARMYNTILCTYVLNVLDPAAGFAVRKDIASLLLPRGVAYLAVRRDFKRDYTTRDGVRQRLVRLELPVVVENSSYCIYKMTGWRYHEGN